jgi:uncharacterized protein (DUF2236 family)
MARERAWRGCRRLICATGGAWQKRELKASDHSRYGPGMDTDQLPHIDTDQSSPLAAPLGPGSLTWRYFGDSRHALLAGRAGILQTMHPAIDAGLREHSDFFDNPWNRIIRSAGPILGVVYDAGWEVTGRTVRDFHRPIKGTAPSGSRYAALDPETYFWAHATFFESQIAGQELFGKPLGEAAKAQLYAESITWYRRYGVSMRPVPPDYAAFQEYWRHMLDHVLEPTPTARSGVRRPSRPLPPPYPWMPGPAWALLRPLLVNSSIWLTGATLPPRGRELLGVDWSPADEARLQALAAAVRAAWRVSPPPLRQLPRARRGVAAARR